MSAKRTHGPWIVESTQDTLWIGTPKAVGHKVADVVTSLKWGADYTDEYNSEQRAKAHLIAAAPELLAMLKMAQLWLDVDGRYDMQGINAAIAKAEAQP